MREVNPMKSNFHPLRAHFHPGQRAMSQTPFMLNKLLTRPGQSQAEGFTLIESLVAIIILAITVVSVLPPIFWATATRVQNRRAEQAVQLAQSEIDRVRVAVERNSVTQAQLPPRVGAALRPNAPAPTNIIPQGTKLRSSVPGCNVDDGTQAPTVNQLILVDTDPEASGTCKPEFMIQTFRGTGKPLDDGATAPQGFVMGVRVYSIVAANNNNGTYTLKPDVQAAQGILRSTKGLGTQQSRPLATQYSTIVRSSTNGSLDIYRQLCEASGDACAAPPP
jgi:prepilin-type N-terminal cleavage/methylation domain-containing protein